MLKIIFGAALIALLGTALAATAQTAVPAEPHLQAAQTESDRANALFDEIFDRKVARDPVYQTYLGLKTNYGKWSDLSEAGQAANLAHRQADLKLLQEENRLKARVFSQC